MEAGTLQTDGNATVNGDQAISGGLQVGSGLAVSGSEGLNANGITTGSGLAVSASGLTTGTGLNVNFANATTGVGTTASGLSVTATAPGANTTGTNITNLLNENLPSYAYTGAGTSEINGLNLQGNAVTVNNASGTLIWQGLNLVMPNITQTSGTVASRHNLGLRYRHHRW